MGGIFCSTAVDIKGQLSDHVQFALVLHEAGDGVGREDARGQGEVGVDHRGELKLGRVSDGRVKAGPEHPQEDGSWRDETGKILFNISFKSKRCSSLIQV